MVFSRCSLFHLLVVACWRNPKPRNESRLSPSLTLVVDVTPSLWVKSFFFLFLLFAFASKLFNNFFSMLILSNCKRFTNTSSPSKFFFYTNKQSRSLLHNGETIHLGIVSSISINYLKDSLQVKFSPGVNQLPTWLYEIEYCSLDLRIEDLKFSLIVRNPKTILQEVGSIQ